MLSAPLIFFEGRKAVTLLRACETPGTQEVAKLFCQRVVPIVGAGAGATAAAVNMPPGLACLAGS